VTDRLGVAGRVVWTATLLGGVSALCIGRSAGQGDDFVQDYIGGRLWLNGEPPYQDMPAMRERFGFQPAGQPVARNPHPPLAILLAAPFAWLPFESAFLAYQVAQVLCLAWAWNASCRTFARGGWGPATLGGLLGVWSPVWQGLDWGQPVGFVAVTALLLWRAARGGAGPAVAGAALALACGLRPFFAVVAATAARWPAGAVGRAILAAGATTLALFAAVRLSPIDWLRNGAGIGHTFTDQCGSVPGLLGLGGLTGMWFYAATVAGVAVARRVGVGVDACVAAGLVFGLLTYPLAWFHYDAALSPVLVWLVATAHARGRTPAVIAAALFVALRAVPNMQGDQRLQQLFQVAARALLGAGVLMAVWPGRSATGREPLADAVAPDRN
jgi:hypothetical protein